MGYKTTRDVDFDGKKIVAGKPITFADSDEGRAARDQLLALVPPAIEGDGEKPLAKMTKAELATIVAAEEVEVAADATNAVIVAAIEAKRAATGQA